MKSHNLKRTKAITQVLKMLRAKDFTWENILKMELVEIDDVNPPVVQLSFMLTPEQHRIILRSK